MRNNRKLKFTLSGLLSLLAVACAPAPDRSAAADPVPVKTAADGQGAAETSSAMTGNTIQPLEKPHEEWRPLVPADSYRVLFEEGTEPAFSSPLNAEKRDGTYVCAACNLPLFSSDTKFDSGTGWPSFFDPIPGRLGTDQDLKLMVPRTEYHCVRCGGHQGHVFDDGPAPTGLRYCNNGVALRFVPKGEPLPMLEGTASAIFAGGCFWCIEASLEAVPGVLTVVSGYIGGKEPDPTYHEVSSGRTGHAEAVQVVYDSTQVTYPELLHSFWRNIDPLVADRQFCDAGTQYRAEIFYGNETERQLAEESKRRLVESGRFVQPIVTGITAATTFYPAEDYHQDYYRKNPVEYQAYRFGCGRDRRLKELWRDAAAH